MNISMVEVVFTAPLVAIQARKPRTFHAVTLNGLPDGWAKGNNRRLPRSACGVPVRLYPGPKYELTTHHTDEPHERTHTMQGVVPWPPRVATLGKSAVRCKACFDATGKPRPRAEIAPSSSPTPTISRSSPEPNT